MAYRDEIWKLVKVVAPVVRRLELGVLPIDGKPLDCRETVALAHTLRERHFFYGDHRVVRRPGVQGETACKSGPMSKMRLRHVWHPRAVSGVWTWRVRKAWILSKHAI